MKLILILLLVIVAIVMIYLGVNLGAKPPILTGIGFIIISALFFDKSKKD